MPSVERQVPRAGGSETSSAATPAEALNWPISLIMVIALGASLGGIAPLLRDSAWWAVALVVAFVVMVAIAVVRALTRLWFWGPLAGALVLIVVLTLFYAPDRAIAGFLPTPGVFEAFGTLVDKAFFSIANQSVPARVETEIAFLLAAGTGAIAIVLDGLAFVVRRPALIGIPLLVLLSVGGIVDPSSYRPGFAIVTALAYLLVLYLAIGERRFSGAFAVGAAGLAGAIALPLLLPPIALPETDRGDNGVVVGINTFVSLGDDLRRPTVSRVLTYATNSGFGQYLTVTVIDEFTGTSWGPRPPMYRSANRLDSIDPAPGLGPDIDVLTSTTAIAIDNLGGKWLPAPASPRRVEGLNGEWSWNPLDRTISTPNGSIRGAEYTVVSDLANPTVQDLRASGTEAPVTLLQRDLAIPGELDPVVAQIAREVTAGAETHFDMAVALQDYFTGGDFTYSTESPVLGNYDGTGAVVIAQFLQAKSGYCVHFASAMAVMARTLGIPARIAVGFTPGEFQTDGDNSYFAVTTANLHSWPELYFAGVGWVRFEPTVSVGEQPVFADAEAGPVPSTVVSAAPTAVPTLTAEPTATPTPTVSPTLAAAQGGSAGNPVVQWVVVGSLIAVGLGVLGFPLVPIVRRAARRGVRYWRIARHQSAVDAWLELADTALDLGYYTQAMTPRELAEALAAGLSERAEPALERLRSAIETDAYSRDSGRATVADVRRVRRAMWINSSREQRLRAAFTPRSVTHAASALGRHSPKRR